ncbi:MAG TPA: transcriptional regulator [Acidobacteria bacterium]|nr:transcriptional regulator [Acidobacteriota bacterium]
MPLYEYQCDACGHRFERIRKFSDPPLTVCPKCDGVIRKLVSSPAIQFKGTGWYVTDYANKGRSDTEASEAGKSSDEKSTKTDTKKTQNGDSKTTKSSDASASSSSTTSSKNGSSSSD